MGGGLESALAADDMHDLELIEDATLRPVEVIGRGVLVGWVAGGCGVRAAVSGRGDEKPPWPVIRAYWQVAEKSGALVEHRHAGRDLPNFP